MKHIFQKGTDPNRPLFLLLHGTGGNESDLLSVAKAIDPFASVLGVRGNISENGMPRFFKRKAEGIFDEEDLVFRTKELEQFVDRAADDYQFNRSRVIAIGYSNGANIAASLLFHFREALKGAILFHPMVPLRGIGLPDLSGTPVFIGAGTADPICSHEETKELAELLSEAGADVRINWERNDHRLTISEIRKAHNWYARLLNERTQ